MKRLLLAVLIASALASPAIAGCCHEKTPLDRLIDQWSNAMVDCRNPKLSDQKRDQACNKAASLGDKLGKAGCWIERSTTWQCVYDFTDSK